MNNNFDLKNRLKSMLNFNRRFVLGVIILMIFLLLGVSGYIAYVIVNRQTAPEDTAAARDCSAEERYVNGLCKDPNYLSKPDQAQDCARAAEDLRICIAARDCERGGGVWFENRCEQTPKWLEGKLDEGSFCNSNDDCKSKNCGIPDGNPCGGRKTCGRILNSQCEAIRQPPPGSGGTSGNPACPKGNGQNAIIGEYKQCESQGSDIFTGVQRCLENGWGPCQRATGLQPGLNGQCPGGSRPINGLCYLDCDGNSNICACGNNICVGNTVTKFTCEQNSCKPVSSGGWLVSSANCRVRAPVTTCAPAEFRGCNPGVNQMCWCRGLGAPQSDGYSYGTAELGPLGCGADCTGKPGGVYSDSACGNPYRCPDGSTGRSCRPTTYCDPATNQRVTITCDSMGNQQTAYVPEECQPCSPRVGCEGTNYVVRNCRNEIITSRYDPACDRSCPETNYCDSQCNRVYADCNGRVLRTQRDDSCCSPYNGFCASLTVSYIDETGQNILKTVDARTPVDQLIFEGRPRAGSWVTIASTANKPNPNPKPGLYFIRGYMHNSRVHEGCNYYFPSSNEPPYTPDLYVISFQLPSDLYNGTVRRNDAWGRRNNCDPIDFSRGVLFGAIYFFNGTWTRDSYFCLNSWTDRAPNPANARVYYIPPEGPSQLQNTQCENYCNMVALTRTAPPTTPPTTLPPTTPPPTTTPTVPPAQCVSITITNARNNQSCNASNPQACNVRQGDTLNIQIQGTNANSYFVNYAYQVASGQRFTQTISPQSSPSFNLQIPNNQELQNILIEGYTSNGTTSSTANNCRIGFSFAPQPTVNKDIDQQNSVNLSTGNVVNSTSIVEYDVSISNTGTASMQNVIVVDRLRAYNSAGNELNPPFGDIIQASNLTRSGGTVSTPSTVAPRRLFDASGNPIGAVNPGNNYNQTDGVKRVEWNRVDVFAPGESYSGTVRVDISNYTGTPSLQNEFCLYRDVNNNGQLDSGDTLIACDEVIVRTAQPDFTISKQSNRDMVNPGGSVNYTLTFTNVSSNPLDLNTITIRDTLDQDAINSMTVSNISNGGSISGNVITWSSQNLISANNGNPNLAPNQSIQLSYTVTINNNYFPSRDICTDVITNQARAISDSRTELSNVVNVNVMGQCRTPEPSLPPGPTNGTTIIVTTGLPDTNFSGYINWILIFGILALSGVVGWYVIEQRRKVLSNQLHRRIKNRIVNK